MVVVGSDFQSVGTRLLYCNDEIEVGGDKS